MPAGAHPSAHTSRSNATAPFGSATPPALPPPTPAPKVELPALLAAGPACGGGAAASAAAAHATGSSEDKSAATTALRRAGCTDNDCTRVWVRCGGVEGSRQSDCARAWNPSSPGCG
eukprot:210038-Chlamydomonas_euryale.AAC.1